MAHDESYKTHLFTAHTHESVKQSYPRKKTHEAACLGPQFMVPWFEWRVVAAPTRRCAASAPPVFPPVHYCRGDCSHWRSNLFLWRRTSAEANRCVDTVTKNRLGTRRRLLKRDLKHRKTIGRRRGFRTTNHRARAHSSFATT